MRSRRHICNIILTVVLIHFMHSFTVFGQESLKDSLRQVLQTAAIKDTNYINALNELAEEQLYYNLDSISILASEALRLSNSLKFPKGEAEAYLNLGIYHSEKDASDKALSYFEQAKKSAEINQDTITLLETYANIGIEYQYRNQYAAAATILMEGIEIAKKSKNNLLLELLLGNLAGVYIDQNDYPMAIELDKETLRLMEALNRESVLANPLFNLAHSYNSIGDYEKATEHVDRLVEVLGPTKMMNRKFRAYVIKGEILYNQQAYKEALAWYEKSEELLSNIEDKRVEISLWNNKAMAYLRLDSFQEARQYALRALNLTTNNLYFRERSISYDILSQIAEGERDFQEALKFHKKFKAYEDSLNTELKDKEFNILKANREFEKEKEILIKKNEISLLQQKSLNYFFGALLLFTLVMLFIYRKTSQIQKRLNVELASSKKALQDNEVRLKQSNKIKDRLFSIIGHDLRSPIISLKQLLDLCLTDGEDGAALLKRYAPKLQGSLNHFQFTLDNLLDWGTSQIKGDNLKPEKIALRKELEALSGFYELLLREKSIEMVIHVEPDSFVYMDVNHFRIIFRNLLSNAIKFTPAHGKITLEAAECHGNSMCITVSDTGDGMDAKTLAKVLSDEEHYSSHGTQGEKGSGLGLLLSKNLITKNHGHLHIESKTGSGSSFKVEFPKEEATNN